MTQPSFSIGRNRYAFQPITLRKYYALQDLLANQGKGTEFEVVSQLTDCPTEILRKLKFKDWQLVWEEAQIQIGNLVGNADAVTPIVEFRGTKYGLVPIDDMTVGEFADLDLVLTTGNPERKLEDIAAIVYRPILKQKGEVLELEPYDVKGFQMRKELFMDLPLSAIRSANAFFLQYANSSLKNILQSLAGMKETKMLPPADQEILQKFLQQDHGGLFSTSWLEQTLLNLQALRNSRSDQHLIGLRGKKKKLRELLLRIKNKFKKEGHDYPSLP